MSLMEYQYANASVLPRATRMHLPCFFQSGMLFQQEKPICFWGVDIPGKTVSVTLKSAVGAETETVTARDADGFWKVCFPSRKASFESLEATVCGSEQVVLRDILVGELFIASGQSNMYWPVENTKGGLRMLQEANRPALRLLWMPANPQANGSWMDLPQFEYKGVSWGRGDDEQAVRRFSAVAYTFACTLYDRLQVPVGVMESSMGGMIIEPFLPSQTVKSDEQLKRLIGMNATYRPLEQIDVDSLFRVATFFNSKIAPMCGLSVRGIVWYQGESNFLHAEHYGSLLQALIQSWSEAYAPQQTEPLPFVACLLAPHFSLQWEGSECREAGCHLWPTVNEQICTTLQKWENHTAVIPIYDILPTAETAAYTQERVAREEAVVSATTDHPVHPIDKQPVGTRAGEAMYHLCFGKASQAQAPCIGTVEYTSDGALLTFENVQKQLVIANGRRLREFYLAGQDGKWMPAEASITSKNTVFVSNPFIENPCSVQYAFSAMNLYANLADQEGLPAVPFRHGTAAFSYLYRPWVWMEQPEEWVNSGDYFTFRAFSNPTFRFNEELVRPMVWFGSGMRAAYCGSEGVTFSAQTEGLAVSYPAGTVSFGPVLHYPGLQNALDSVGILQLTLKNADARNKKMGPLQLKTANGARYSVAASNDCLQSTDKPQSFTFDLDTVLDEQGKKLPLRKRKQVLRCLETAQWTLTDAEKGEVICLSLQIGP